MINFSGTRRSWILLKLVNLLKIFSYFERGVLTKMRYFFRIFFRCLAARKGSFVFNNCYLMSTFISESRKNSSFHSFLLYSFCWFRFIVYSIASNINQKPSNIKNEDLSCFYLFHLKSKFSASTSGM